MAAAPLLQLRHDDLIRIHTVEQALADHGAAIARLDEKVCNLENSVDHGFAQLAAKFDTVIAPLAEKVQAQEQAIASLETVRAQNRRRFRAGLRWVGGIVAGVVLAFVLGALGLR